MLVDAVGTLTELKARSDWCCLSTKAWCGSCCAFLDRPQISVHSLADWQQVLLISLIYLHALSLAPVTTETGQKPRRQQAAL